MYREVQETLNKQFQLLAERSQEKDANLAELTHAMVELAECIKTHYSYRT